MKINITVPVWNETATIAKTVPYLAQLCEGLFLSTEIFIVVADNGSTDNTREVMEKLTHANPNIVYTYMATRGRGNALATSWQQYQADIYGYIDADLDTDPAAFKKMVKLITKDCDLVVGSRVHPESVIVRPWYRKFTSIWSNLVVRLLFNLDPTDTQCGLKLINSRAKEILLPEIKEKGWFFDLELLLRARKHGLKIGIVPVNDKFNRFMKRKSKVLLFKDSLVFLKTAFRLKRQGL